MRLQRSLGRARLLRADRIPLAFGMFIAVSISRWPHWKFGARPASHYARRFRAFPRDVG